MNYEDKSARYIPVNTSGGVSNNTRNTRRNNTGNKKKKKKGALTARQKIGKSLAVVGTTIASMLMVVVITICIVAVGLTVYVMQFAENSFDIDLTDVELSYSSFIYAYDSNNEVVEVKRLNTDENRIWVDIETIPQHVLDAIISVEDTRFLDHEGVDWKRTIGVSLQAIFNGGTDGGSTITQQLVRDVTGDKKVTIGRKLREIFRAMALEKKYTKMDILESYLNRIAFGGTVYGIGSAAKHYFDKDISELTIAEGAILAGIIRSPSNYNPYANLKQAKTRQTYALDKMYEYGYISTKEYEDALVEQVHFRKPVSGDYFGYTDERYAEYYGILVDEDEDLYYENVEYDPPEEDAPYKWAGDYEITQDWYTDAAINQVVNDLAELKGVTLESARDLLYHGGYSVYLNVDQEKQKILEEKFIDPYLCLSYYDPYSAKEHLLQASFVIMDYKGRVVALVGGLGEKEGDNCFNRATQAIQSIGSTVKPLATYSPAIENNLITYSTMLRDISGKIPASEAGSGAFDADSGYDPSDNTVRWPHNYQEKGFGTGNYYPAWYAVQKSTNTIAVRVLSMVGLQNSYTYMTQRLGFSTIDSVNDISYSPLGTGAFTNGIKLIELAAAYQTIGNGGIYYEPYLYSKVLDSEGKVVLEQNYVGTQAISKDTAYIVNRMMLKVVQDPYGTGKNAILPNVEVVGKTGTANDLSAYLFCGLTPDYVGVYRISRDDNKTINSKDGWLTVAKVWHDVMADIQDTTMERSFTPDSSVITANYCTETGLIATSRCPSTAVGYYRKSNIPNSCTSKHDGTYWTLNGDFTIPVYK